MKEGIDASKIDDAVLALLYLTIREEAPGVYRAWKSHDWDAMERLYGNGYISNPRSRSKSVTMTDEGAKRSAELFEKLFSMTK